MRFGIIGAMAVAGVLVMAQPVGAQAQDDGHPAADYQRAATLFAKGERDEAVCLFYRGQYRYRVHLAARPELEASGDAALFASLNQTVGLPINEWAGGDPEGWAEEIACALDWPRTHDDPSHAESGVSRRAPEDRSGARRAPRDRPQLGGRNPCPARRQRPP